ncbi:thiamine phosphate synthase [Sphingomonas spermidinifaciens]|uniref:Thiamine phosphate synthase n=1 Tax=Sphingomonas spermidinifaciens TaxID=1141889 RepID=A0A2A4B1W6_9SPHN|nr:thiamine phosphate synthase [Sphingomonas spermidinifaciens]PCD01932.1 thiamine phosphate synthase [Sphingomonas spermidinifaciens]
MRARHPDRLPRLWLMTDERLGERVWPALAALPRGSGVVFRDYATPLAERRARFARVCAVARRRGLVLVRAGDVPMRREAGVHNGRGRGLRTASAHSPAELVAARRSGADLVFVSPVFATRSHLGARTLGPVRLGLLLRRAALPAIALGGMNARSFRRLRGLGLHGWAAIDGLSDRTAPSSTGSTT